LQPLKVAFSGFSRMIIRTAIPDVLIIEPEVFGDSRGFFMEVYQKRKYLDLGITPAMVQDNLSRSARGVLRGLHIQHPNSQGKLVTVLQGAVLDVAVDVRVGSPTFGKHVSAELDDLNRRQLWVPRGFAHGFLVLSDTADFFYKCDNYYSPSDELVLRWNDPALGVNWGIIDPELSARDRDGLTLQELHHKLPAFGTP
jgi:dTDP-4-dehydrorhamnose 3,5-epimerase